MHSDQCLCGSLQVLQVQTPRGGGVPSPDVERIPTSNFIESVGGAIGAFSRELSNRLD